MRHECAPGSAQDWLSRAKGKFVLASQSLPEGGYWEDLCFMAQQSAELALKAVYQHFGWRFDFVHDLGHLLDGLENHNLDVPDYLHEAERLTIFATQMRYPGITDFVTQDTYVQLLSIAEKVIYWSDNTINFDAMP